MYPKGSTSESGVLTTSAEDRFSLPYLKKLHQQLVDNKRITPENENLVVEILRIIAEMVVYGDSKSEMLFDFFCEKNMLSLFLELMWAEDGCPSKVHVQILQTLSILVNCVKNNTSLYYLLSNNHVNEIIIYPHKFDEDESLRDQFVSFMKSLSLRLNKQTVQFFFIEETGAFPILTRAIDLLLDEDHMVRIAAQTTILNVFRVTDLRARRYALQDEVLHRFFSDLITLMKLQYTSIVALCLEQIKEFEEVRGDPVQEGRVIVRLEARLSDVFISSEDLMYYLQDLFELKIMGLRRALVHHMLSDFVCPILLHPLQDVSRLLPRPHGRSPDGESKRDEAEGMPSGESSSVSAIVSLVYLLQMFRIISDKMMQRGLMCALLHPLDRWSRGNITQVILNRMKLSGISSTSGGDEKEGEAEAAVGAGAGGGEGEEWDFSINECSKRNPHRVTVLQLLHSGGESFSTLCATLLRVMAEGAVAACTADDDATQHASEAAAAVQAFKVFGLFGDAEAPKGRAEELLVEMKSKLVFRRDGGGSPGAGAGAGAGGELADGKKRTRMRSSSEYSREEEEEMAAQARDDIDDVSDAMSPSEADVLPRDVLALMAVLTPQPLRVHCPSAPSPSPPPRSAESKDEKVDADDGSTSRGIVTDVGDLSMLDVMFHVIRAPSKHSLLATQECIHAIYSMGRLLFLRSGRSGGGSTVPFSSSPPSSPSSSSPPPTSPLSSSSPGGERALASTHSEEVQIIFSALLNGARVAVRDVASSLLTHLTSPLGDLVLGLVQEELWRIKGRKWSAQSIQMSKEPALLLAQPMAIARHALLDLGTPSNELDTVRRDVQMFLLCRSLYKRLVALAVDNGLSPCPFPTTDEVVRRVIDEAVMGYTDTGSIPPQMKIGCTFDMRGKKFLDAYLITTANPGSPKPTSGRFASPSVPSSASSKTMTPEDSSPLLSSSIFGFGFLGGAAGPGPSTPSPAKLPTPTPSTTPTPNGKRFGEVLLVQDSSFVVIVQIVQEEFKVWFVAPVQNCEVNIGPDDGRKLTIFLRSFERPPHTEYAESPIAGAGGPGTGFAASSSSVLKGPPGLLSPKAARSLHRVTLCFENEQSCILAAQFIEVRRNKMRSSKQATLRGLLEVWANENPNHPVTEPIPSTMRIRAKS